MSFQASSQQVTDEFIQNIENALMQSITTLYGTTANACDPEFRVVNSVNATVATSGSRRRKLQRSRERKVQQVLSEAAPSASPALSESLRPSFSLAGLPTQAPTAPTANSGVVDFFLYVSGVCNGCENDITLGDQTVGRRLQQVKEWDRKLQSEATSSCFCPIGAVVIEPPTIGELFTVFSATLLPLNVTFQILDLGEVLVVDCRVPLTLFTTQFQYTIALEPDITSAQVQAVGVVIKSAYNSLGQDYCGPFDQAIDSVQLVQFSPSNWAVGQNQCTDYDVTFQVTGSCRGCDGSSLFTFTTTSGGRRLAMKEDPFTSFSYDLFTPQNTSSRSIIRTTARSSRRLQVSTDSTAQCFCDGTVVANRAPNVEEYETALSTALNAFEVTNVCGVPGCFLRLNQPWCNVDTNFGAGVATNTGAHGVSYFYACVATNIGADVASYCSAFVATLDNAACSPINKSFRAAVGNAVSETISETSASPSTSALPSTSTFHSAIPSTSAFLSALPSTSAFPSDLPSTSVFPSDQPSTSAYPSGRPSTSMDPSMHPSTSVFPSASPSRTPSAKPSSSPSRSAFPSVMPTSGFFP